jgi:hypothetical protein
MLKHNRVLVAIGAATMLATLASAPAHAAEAGNGPDKKSRNGAGSTLVATMRSAPAAGCKEMTVDGGFETPKLGRHDAYRQFDQEDVTGWRTDDPEGQIKIWAGSAAVPARFGKQFGELNATGQGTSVYQDITTKSNTKIYWSFWIRARDSSGGTDVDATQIHFSKTPKKDGQVNGNVAAFTYANSADDAHWKRLYGWYLTGPNQTSTRVTLTAVDSASTDDGYGNLVDGLTIVDHPGCF